MVLLLCYNSRCRRWLIELILLTFEEMTDKEKTRVAKTFVKIYKQYPSGRFIEMLDEYETTKRPQKDTDKVSVSMHVPRKK